MDGRREPWIRNGALALVVQLSRVAGVAPLVFTENGPRVSLALSIYGQLLITVIGGITIWLSVYHDTQSIGKKDVIYDAKTTQILLQWLSYSTLITNIISGFLAAGRMKSLIDIVKRVEMVEAKLDTNNSAEAKNKEKQVVVLYFVTFSLFFTIESYFQTLHIPFNTAFVIMRVTIFMRCSMSSITSMQLILTCRHIGALFPRYNDCLQHLLESIDDKKKTDLIAFRTGFGKNTHIHSQRVYVSPRSLSTIVDGIGMFPSTMNAAESTQSTLWHLNAVYTEICALVDIMNHRHNGITLFLVLFVYTISLISAVYHAVNKFISTPLSILLLLIEVYWLIHHLTYICLVIECGHRIIYETIEIKRTVSKLMGKAMFLKDGCVEELNKLFVKLMLMEPILSPLNVYTLSRGLIISIIGAAATYSVIVVQFRSSEV